MDRLSIKEVEEIRKTRITNMMHHNMIKRPTYEDPFVSLCDSYIHLMESFEQLESDLKQWKPDAAEMAQVLINSNARYSIQEKAQAIIDKSKE